LDCAKRVVRGHGRRRDRQLGHMAQWPGHAVVTVAVAVGACAVVVRALDGAEAGATPMNVVWLLPGRRRAAACRRKRSCDGGQGWMAGHHRWRLLGMQPPRPRPVRAGECMAQEGRHGAHGQEPRSGRRS
jgi:hypothetical protein